MRIQEFHYQPHQFSETAVLCRVYNDSDFTLDPRRLTLQPKYRSVGWSDFDRSLGSRTPRSPVTRRYLLDLVLSGEPEVSGPTHMVSINIRDRYIMSSTVKSTDVYDTSLRFLENPLPVFVFLLNPVPSVRGTTVSFTATLMSTPFVNVN